MSSSELSPEKGLRFQKSHTIRSGKNPKSINFEGGENTNSRLISRTNTRGLSGVELESDSIYKGKMLGFEQKELSGGETASQKHESTLIDKEVKGRLRNSLAVRSKPKGDPMIRVKTSLTLSEDRRMGDLFDPENTKYLSSGDFTENYGNGMKKQVIQNIENIDEESGEGMSKVNSSSVGAHWQQEHELRDAFIENLREMVTGVFKDLKRELQDSSEAEVFKILQERERTTNLQAKYQKNGLISEKASEILKIQDQMLMSLSSLLGSQLTQSNKVKGMLIDTLMFLDKQVLEMSKIQRIMDKKKKNFGPAKSNFYLKRKFTPYQKVINKRHL